MSERASLLKASVRDLEKAKSFVRNDPALYRWYGIVLSDYTAFQGSKEAISSAFEVRGCFAQALTLDPNDASAHHLMGRWALSIATMSPWTRWFASTLYAEPPRATLEEALACFERAEAISPGFWVANTYCLAKTAHLMGNREQAVRWATSALRLPVLNSDDKENHKLAHELLKGLDAKAAGEFTG
jgi:tetratricopeptide (TPR) repeat protein